MIFHTPNMTNLIGGKIIKDYNGTYNRVCVNSQQGLLSGCNAAFSPLFFSVFARSARRLRLRFPPYAGVFSISTSASFGFMISRGAPGVKPAFPVISSDEYFFVFLLDNFTLMC